jgi:hypothetical protein
VDNVIDKVEHLISLALNPEASLEESRTAAVTAIKIIQEYDLLRAVKEGVAATSSKRSLSRITQTEDLGEVVQLRGNLFIKFLIQESIQGRFPLSNAKVLTDQTIEEGLISPLQGDSFRVKLREFLRKKVNNGVLSSTKRGYSLRRS